MTASAFAAAYFDGHVSASVPVSVAVHGDALVVTHEGQPSAAWPLAQVNIAEHFARTPRMLVLPTGATLEVPDGDGRFDASLQAAGIAPTRVQRLQRHRFAAVIGLALCVALGVYAYVDGIPAVARAVAMRFPHDLEQKLGTRLLADADNALFSPSQLPDARRAELGEKFAQAARVAAPDIDYRVVWRRMGKSNMVNALTLPGGTIVMLDGLEDAVDDDDALVGVFGHELGHVAGRHTLRQMVQVAGVGGLASMVWGDMSSVLLNGAVVLSSLDYSRAMEREADTFGARLLKANRISAVPLIRFLNDMEAERAADGDDYSPGFLTTHPVTAERIERLRKDMTAPP